MVKTFSEKPVQETALAVPAEAQEAALLRDDFEAACETVQEHLPSKSVCEVLSIFASILWCSQELLRPCRHSNLGEVRQAFGRGSAEEPDGERTAAPPLLPGLHQSRKSPATLRGGRSGEPFPAAGNVVLARPPHAIHCGRGGGGGLRRIFACERIRDMSVMGALLENVRMGVEAVSIWSEEAKVDGAETLDAWSSVCLCKLHIVGTALIADMLDACIESPLTLAVFFREGNSWGDIRTCVGCTSWRSRVERNRRGALQGTLH